MDISPMTVHYFREGKNTLGVIVQLFSIIGGIFMVAKFIDTFLSSFWTPRKRAEDSETLGGLVGI